MAKLRVGVVGASGYSGAVAARLVAQHPGLVLAFATSDRLRGTRVAAQLAMVTPGDLRFEANGDASRLAEAADVVILATSAEVSARLAPELVEAGRDVVDLSGAFRLANADDYPTWYGFTHPAAGLLGRAHYGLPELFGVPFAASPHPGAEAGPGSSRGRLIANPGCYPTAALLALGPLLRSGIVEPLGLIVDAKSGVTGAGRQAKEEYSFAEIDENIRAYKLLAHQHTPEIARGLDRLLGPSDRPATIEPNRSLVFSAHLLPVKRGILATCYARPRAGVKATAYAECLADAYRASAFVDVVAPEEVTLTSVVGTNGARVAATANQDFVIALVFIDNLLKGAAGQAVQNLNLLHGLGEATGLEPLQRVSP